MAIATRGRSAIVFPMEDFKNAFATAAKASPGRVSPRPVLLSVKLEIDKGEAVFTSTNLEMWVQHRIPSDYEGDPVSVLISKSTMASILRVADGDEIELVDCGDRLEIKTAASSWRVPTEAAESFPAPPELDVTAYHEVEAEDFALAIKRVIREARPDTSAAIEFEPLLTAITLTSGGVNSLANQKVPAVATGGSMAPAKLPLLPDSAVKTLAGILASSDETVRVGFPNENWVRFESGGTTLLARQVSGTFLRWRDHASSLPDPVGKFTIPCRALRLAIERASIALDDNSRAMELEFSERGRDEAWFLKLTAESTNGRSNSELEIEWTGDEIEVRIDPQYLKGMLMAIEDDATLTVEVHEKFLVVRAEDGFLGFAATLKEPTR